MMNEKQLSLIKNTALRMLTRRDHSQHELALKLQVKGYDPSAIKFIIANLLEAGLINEDRFTENYIHWRRTKGYGPLRITNELHSRGISAEMIAEHLQITDNDWLIVIQTVWQKYFKTKRALNFKEQAKQLRFLQYRGFTRDQIATVLQID